MKTQLKLSALTAVLALSAVSATAAPEKMTLWPEKAPIGDGQFDTALPTITVYKPAPEKATGTAMIICPGGGYGGLVTGAEGHGIAKWLDGYGIAGIVLEYRLPKGRAFVPLLDAQRAIRIARSHAAEWGLNPQRIGIIGFSAGGHLASTAATHFDEGNANSVDAVEKVSSRPDFAILVYPVVTFMGPDANVGTRNNLLGPNANPELDLLFSNEKQVTAKSSPMFMAHAVDDKVVTPANSKMLYEACKANNVPAEYLELPDGGHGLSGYKGPSWDAWQTKSIAWLAAQKFVTLKPGS